MRARGIGLLLLACAGAAQAAPTERPDDELRRRLIAAVERASSFEHRYEAEVWLMDMSTRLKKILPDDAQRLELLRLVHQEARNAQLAPELVLAVIDVESRFNRFAVSTAGAQGLMQIMPFWLDEIGKPGDNLFDVQTNLRFGCTILKYYLEREKGGMVGALARYNGSYGKPQYPQLVMNALGKRWYKA